MKWSIVQYDIRPTRTHIWLLQSQTGLSKDIPIICSIDRYDMSTTDMNELILGYSCEMEY